MSNDQEIQNRKEVNRVLAAYIQAKEKRLKAWEKLEQARYRLDEAHDSVDSHGGLNYE